VDFASIGTNDLVQYLFAVERNTANAADLYQPEHPVVFEVIHHLTQIAADAGKPIFICGEMAADTSLLPVLVGLGLRHFSLSMSAAAIAVRDLSRLNEVSCQQLAKQCLAVDTVKDVYALLNRPDQQCVSPRVAAEGDVVDPVCGMVVHSNDTPYAIDVEELSHYFCSRSCLNFFVDHLEQLKETAPEPEHNQVAKSTDCPADNCQGDSEKMKKK
jgi:YHS domain-containing protein